MQPENPNNAAGWSFKQEVDAAAPDNTGAPTPTNPQTIMWTGSEYIAQHKDGKWYFVLSLAIAGISIVTFILTKGDILSVVFIAIIGILFGVIAGKPPRQLQYQIDQHGISVGNKHYPFDFFKSFSVMHDGAIGYISLLPLQRLKAELTIYFVPNDEQQIFDTLAQYLPYEQRAENAVERFSKHIRF